MSNGDKQVSKTKDMPSFIVSMNAKHRKEQGESTAIINKLKKQVRMVLTPSFVVALY